MPEAILLLFLLMSTQVICIVTQSLIDNWQVFQICNVISLNNKDCASDLYYVIYSQWMQITLFTFSRKTEPSAIS
jgi:hypothetical protein